MARLGWRDNAGPLERQRPWATGAGWVKGPGDPGMVEIADGVWISEEEAAALRELELQAKREEAERKERSASLPKASYLPASPLSTLHDKKNVSSLHS